MIRKKIGIIIFLIFVGLVLFSVLSFPKEFYTNIINTLKIWLYNVYPSIFTFYIISTCLISFNIISKLAFIIKPFIKFNSIKAYEIFLISILIGNPTSSSLIIDELKAQTITKNDANKLLKVCAFFNPLFIISIIGFSGSLKFAYIIILAIFLTNIIISWFYPTNNTKILPNKKSLIFKSEKVFDAVTSGMYLLIMIAGVMVFSNILKFSITNIIDYLKLNSFILQFFTSNIEASTGVFDIINLNISLPITLSLITFILTFQGISINIQVYNVIKEYEFNFRSILLLRIIQGIIAGIITYIFYLLLII